MSNKQFFKSISLTHWGRVTHSCVGKLTIIASDNGLSPGRRQAIIWTNAGILLFGPLGSNFSEILIEMCTFSFKKMHLKLSSAKWRPFCLGLNVLMAKLTNGALVIPTERVGRSLSIISPYIPHCAICNLKWKRRLISLSLYPKLSAIWMSSLEFSYNRLRFLQMTSNLIKSELESPSY